LKGSYADSSNVFDGTLGVVTWNLHFGEKLDKIIATLEKTKELHEPDLLLLQEIDAEGVDRIARHLRYNYIYYPTVFSHKREKEYGLAILSAWPLKDAERILLPNWLPGWVENRFLIKAVTSVNGQDITVYNTHFDVAWMRHQGDFLGEKLASPEGLTVLGGDFNTWQPSSITELESLMQAVGMASSTETIDMMQVNFSLDLVCMLNIIYPDFCTFDDALPWMEAMVEGIKNNNTHVRVIMENTNSNGLENRVAGVELMEELTRLGLEDQVELRFYNGKIHAKSILMDGELLIIGSHNLHYSAWGDRGLNEYSLATDNPEAIAEYQALFENKWAEAIPFEEAEYGTSPLFLEE
jgi:endonuclease/exonuclease/phosphatase family metal-dependent hydrolase